jgi:deoxyribonuclease V
MNLFEYTYDLVRQIPSGRISTYGAVAKALGDIRASRAVGRMMNQNPNADDMPCFKIVYSDGKLGGFGLGPEDKIRRLKEENVNVKDGKILDFQNVFFDDFQTDYPLKKFHKEQIDLSKKVKINDDFDKINTVAGFDVAYPKNEFEEVCGACVVFDYKSKSVVEEKIVFKNINFPYIPTYLSYREFPLIKELIEDFSTKPSILMLDGNGILHPNRCGYASYTGIMLDLPTIGVAKSLLCGKVEDKIVSINNQKVGYAMNSSRAKKPFYISPGHRISLETSKKVVKNFQKYKLPEPLRQAHIIANKSLHEGG